MPMIEVAPAVRIYAEDLDPGQAKATLVLIHGWPVNGRMFEYQAAQWPRQGIRTVAIDLRGYGYSDKPWQGLNYDTWADDVMKVIDALALQRVVLGGFSMGGAVAMHTAATVGQGRIEKLVLMGAAGPCLAQSDTNPGGVPREAYEGFLHACYSDRAKLNAEFGKALFHKPVSPELDRFFQDLGMQASIHATACGVEQLRDRDLRPELERIKIPTLICHGLHDQVIPFSLGAEVQKKLIPQAELIRFEESGHGLFIDEREKLTSEVARFVLA